MKTKLMNGLAVLMTVMLFVQCDKDDDHINPNELPEMAQTFLTTNYPDKSYTVERDIEDGQVVYDVDLAGGIEVEFNAQGECIYVGGQTNQVPAEVVSSKIQTYINTNYPNATIVEWDLENTYQEVELSNNIELIFDLEGNFQYSRNDDDDDDDNETTVNVNELPATAQTFITTHFPNITITTVKRETEHNITEYEVILSNAFELDFDATGNCIGIDGNKQQIPNSALSNKIIDYVSSNYAPAFITDWDLDTRKQEVELNNGVELVFDLDGNFKYLD